MHEVVPVKKYVIDYSSIDYFSKFCIYMSSNLPHFIKTKFIIATKTMTDRVVWKSGGGGGGGGW